jgi:uncharacterized protein (TIGR02996 family)
VTRGQALLAAIRENPDEDAPRLVYADWLEEHGEEESTLARTELIRAQIQLEHLARDDEQRKRLTQRIEELIAAHQQTWLGPLLQSPVFLRFVRGMPALSMTVAQFRKEAFQKVAQEWFPRAGVFRLGLSKMNGRMVEVVASPALASLSRLALREAKVGDEGMKLLAGCPFLENLVELTIEKPYVSDEGINTLAHSPHLKKLRKLGLINLPCGHQQSVTAASLRVLLDKRRLPHLVALNLDRGNWGISHLAKLSDLVKIPGLARLRSLDLGSNVIDSEGARLLAGCRYLTGLKELFLGKNAIGEEGVEALLASPHLRGLERLHLYYNRKLSPGLQDRLRQRFGAGLKL